ncbi:PREDICTED: uncharacterized protein LOC105152584 [Acromyrmex echinatior]|uniref:uncharacterized protein LOC105152584 n=1 Tax=Acromyrmex echinatior TaxID=103372 RepID=UPI000580C332|nr:PREDICTED: uncharacterized protein LOC105152584 [Acromyrmex echinatior]
MLSASLWSAPRIELIDQTQSGIQRISKYKVRHSESLVDTPADHCLADSRSWEHGSHATLGLQWHPVDDTFAFSIQGCTIENFTKRKILSEIARLFDPLGWLTPVMTAQKSYFSMQKLDWDIPLPQADACHWSRFLEELPRLEQLRINRWLNTGAKDAKVELHGFADASERGYAAVVYLRVINTDDVKVLLLAAKSKVAPIKPVSLPRLELCAVALLTKLVVHTRTGLSLSTAPVTLWSDSKVTLYWIQGHASRWKTYVTNRVSTIQEALPEGRWRHVPGRDNPADCASRGITSGELMDHPLRPPLAAQGRLNLV